MATFKKAKPRTCKNPACDTHEVGFKFTLSTAMNEKDYCSLRCEKAVTGENRKP